MYRIVLFLYHIIGQFFYISSCSAHLYDKSSISLSSRILIITTPPISQKPSLLPTPIISSPKPTNLAILPSPGISTPKPSNPVNLSPPVISTTIPTQPTGNRISSTEMPSKTMQTLSIPITNGWDPSLFSLKNFGTLPTNQYDYPDVEYGIPFHEFYSQMENRYVNFGYTSFFPSYVSTGHIPAFSQGNNRLMVTGCSANHFVSARAAILSVLATNITLNIAFIDYGITSQQLSQLRDLYEYIHKLHMKLDIHPLIIYRKFSFKNAPSWMNINNRRTRGGYSWKVICYFDLMFEWRALGGWIDAGTIIHEGVEKEFQYAALEGMYAPYSVGNIAKWTHQSMIQFIMDNRMMKHVDKTKENCSGGHFFVDFSNTTAVNHIFKPYLQCAYTMKCITPKGTHRRNHRQDQAALTLFIHNAGLQYSANPKYSHRGLFRQERKGHKAMKRLIRSLKRRIERQNQISI